MRLQRGKEAEARAGVACRGCWLRLRERRGARAGEGPGRSLAGPVQKVALAWERGGGWRQECGGGARCELH